MPTFWGFLIVFAASGLLAVMGMFIRRWGARQSKVYDITVGGRKARVTIPPGGDVQGVVADAVAAMARGELPG